MSVETNQADLRPIDPASGKPIGPLAQPGYYRGFNTLSQQKFWDATTRDVVLDRVNHIPEIRFFTPRQARLLTCICDRILPQDDRDASHKIPIMPQIDKRLYDDTHDGYRYEGMPPDREAYPLGLEAIDEIAKTFYAREFVELGTHDQEELLRSLHDGKPQGARDVWKRMPVQRFWMLLVSDCADAYYAHPWSWDEIGFGGPAYPRAYMRLEHGEPEPWEVQERRYEWVAPAVSLSGECEVIAGQAEHLGSPGQGGTH
ncbi:MAG: gluconate 2-dehydrogenase subunit 3 family protein [Candidatus Baltobacteraceae bacterium]